MVQNSITDFNRLMKPVMLQKQRFSPFLRPSLKKISITLIFQKLNCRRRSLVMDFASTPYSPMRWLNLTHQVLSHHCLLKRPSFSFQ